MRSFALLAVLGKELRSTLRDRRAFFAAIVLPLLMPAMMFVLMPLVAALFAPKLRSDTLTIAVQGDLHALQADLQLPMAATLAAQQLGADKLLTLVPVPDLELAMKTDTQKYAAGIAIDRALPEAIGASPVQLRVLINHKKRSASAAEQLIKSAVGKFNQRLMQKKLDALGLSPGQTSPLSVQFEHVGESALSARLLGMFLPLLVLVFSLTGAQSTAIDASAAERERGTFETLLVAPITRLEVLLGKYLAVCIMAALATLMGLLGILLSLYLTKWALNSAVGVGTSGVLAGLLGTMALNVSDIAQMLLSAVSTASALSACALLPCIFARTYKEAQMYMAPGVILAMALSAPAFMSDVFSFGPLLAWLPIAGSSSATALALSSKGEWPLLLASIFVNTSLVVVLLWLMHLCLRREGIIFRA
jgi:sodium transport system permease protein